MATEDWFEVTFFVLPAMTDSISKISSHVPGCNVTEAGALGGKVKLKGKQFSPSFFIKRSCSFVVLDFSGGG